MTITENRNSLSDAWKMTIFNSYLQLLGLLMTPLWPAWSLQLQLRWSRWEAMFLFSNMYVCIWQKKWIVNILLSFAFFGCKWYQTSLPGNRSSPPSSNWQWRECSNSWWRVLQEQWLQGELRKDWTYWFEIIVLMINIAEDLQCRESWQWVLVPSRHPSFPRRHEVLELLPEKDHRIPGDPSNICVRQTNWLIY